MSLDPRHHDFQDTPGGMPQCSQCGVYYGKHDSIDCPCPPSHIAELNRLRSLLDGLVKAVEPFAEYHDFALAHIWPKPVGEDDGTPIVGDRWNGIDGSCEITVGDLRGAREAYLKAKGV